MPPGRPEGRSGLIFLSCVGLCVRLACAQTGDVYLLDSEYTGANFFNGWDFYSGGDPTGGFVTYYPQNSAQLTGLINASANTPTYIGVDYKTVIQSSSYPGRPSIRIATQKSWTHGLFIGDFAHTPGGICGTWPAFWTLGPNWPYTGEIDILEGVNLLTQNAVSLHTNATCTIAGDSRTQTGTLQGSDCTYYPGYNVGCGVLDSRTNTYGTGFNSAGGGIYAMQWTSDYIRVWVFTRDSIPADILNLTPNPSSWGLPAANLQGSCPIDIHFQQHKIIFDNTFCGSYAGLPSVWNSTMNSCATATGYPDCVSYVAANPSAFQNSFWIINSVRVYQLQANGASSSVTPYIASLQPTSTSTSTTDAAVPTASYCTGGTTYNFTVIQAGPYQYEIGCGYNLAGSNINGPTDYTVHTFEDCVAGCSILNNQSANACAGVTYNFVGNNCYYYRKTGAQPAATNFNWAKLINYAYPAVADDPRVAAATSATTSIFVPIVVTPQTYLSPGANQSSFSLSSASQASSLIGGGMGFSASVSLDPPGSSSAILTTSASTSPANSTFSRHYTRFYSSDYSGRSHTYIQTSGLTSALNPTLAPLSTPPPSAVASTTTSTPSSTRADATSSQAVSSGTTSSSGVLPAASSSTSTTSSSTTSVAALLPASSTTSAATIPPPASSTTSAAVPPSIPFTASPVGPPPAASTTPSILETSSTISVALKTTSAEAPIVTNKSMAGLTTAVERTPDNGIPSGGNGDATTTGSPTETPILTGQPATLYGFRYGGCYGSSSGLSRFFFAENSDSMSVDQCVSDCYNSPYAGIYFTFCYCGETIEATESLTFFPDGECNIPCPGQATQICGGRIGEQIPVKKRQTDEILLTIYENELLVPDIGVSVLSSSMEASSSTETSLMSTPSEIATPITPPPTSTSKGVMSVGPVSATLPFPPSSSTPVGYPPSVTSISPVSYSLSSINSAQPLSVSSSLYVSSSTIPSKSGSIGVGLDPGLGIVSEMGISSSGRETLPGFSPTITSSSAVSKLTGFTYPTIIPIIVSTVWIEVCDICEHGKIQLATTVTVMHCGCTENVDLAGNTATVPSPSVPMTVTVEECNCGEGGSVSSTTLTIPCSSAIDRASSSVAAAMAAWTAELGAQYPTPVPWASMAIAAGAIGGPGPPAPQVVQGSETGPEQTAARIAQASVSGLEQKTIPIPVPLQSGAVPEMTNSIAPAVGNLAANNGTMHSDTTVLLTAPPHTVTLQNTGTTTSLPANEPPAPPKVAAPEPAAATTTKKSAAGEIPRFSMSIDAALIGIYVAWLLS